VRKVVDILSWIIGAMSLVLLAKQGFDFGLVAPLARAVDFYEKLMRHGFGWAEPYLSDLFRWAGLSLRLYPHWKHVLVLMWLYFGVVFKVIWPKFKSRRERALLLVLTAWGALLAFGASLAAGAVALRDGRSNGLMAVFPLVGFVFYQLAWAGFLAAVGSQETWWNRYRAAARLYIGPGTIGVILAGLILGTLADKLPFARALPNFGLALLFVLVIILAFYWLWTGVQGAVLWHKPPDGSWWQTFRSMSWWKSWRVMSNARIGLSMLKAIGGAVLVILMGAGLD
jgi:hypothetical protein